MVTFESDALSKLSSPDQLELLNAIDRLRLQGISNYVSLPQIIVCGDQSSGKSSVLEALAGVPFPVKSNLCTRFPTELVLRRSPYISANVSIKPDEGRSESERQTLGRFSEGLDGFEGLPSLIESAKLAMGISMHGKAFSKDLLRVEISGPNYPHLTIVDLPGLIHSETKHQTASDVELVQEVVHSYMEEPRSIILAVVSAKNDFANQIVLKLARKADPAGNRTLGVITKPDTLTPGSGSESLFVSLARNQEFEFRLGWHVLKNLDSEKNPGSLLDRDASEAAFFSQGIWTNLPLTSKGVDRLRSRLNKVLLKQISSELPGLISEIDTKFKNCHDQLIKLGTPRTTEIEQRRYLLQVSQAFQALVKSAVDASYNDPFFGDAKTTEGYHRRMRAVIQNLNEEFAKEISMSGHLRSIVPGRAIGSKQITQDKFLDHVEDLMRRTRGRELPGTVNPLIVTELFREQCRPWEGIADRHVEKVWDAASQFLGHIMTHLADDGTSKSLQQDVIQPAMKSLLTTLRAKTASLLNPHYGSHPITYNHYFTETLQKVRRDRLGVKDPHEIVAKFFGQHQVSSNVYISGYYDLEKLAASLSQPTEADMNRYAAKEAMDCLEAYYKVCNCDTASVHSLHKPLGSGSILMIVTGGPQAFY